MRLRKNQTAKAASIDLNLCLGLAALIGLASSPVYAYSERYSGQTNTSFGADIFNISAEISGPLYQYEGSENFFRKKRADQEYAGAHDKKKAYPFRWNFGLSYGSLGYSGTTTVASGTDRVYSGVGGFNWQFHSNWDFVLQVSGNDIQNERYTKGMIIAEIGYTRFLDRHSSNTKSQPIPESVKPEAKPEANQVESEYDSTVADPYFKKKRAQKLAQIEQDFIRASQRDQDSEGDAARKSSRDRDPHFRMALILGARRDANQYDQTVVTSDASASSTPTVSQTTLDQSIFGQTYGAKFEFVPDDVVRIVSTNTFYFYSNSVNQWVSTLKVDPRLRQNFNPSGGFSPLFGQVFLFPDISFDQSFEFRFFGNQFLTFNFNETAYQASNQKMTFGLGGTYHAGIGNHWTAIFGVSMMTGGISSKIVLGHLGVEYRW